MQEKAPDKLISAERELFFFIVVTAIPVAEPDSAVIDSDNPVVGDGYLMGVPAQILEYLLRSAEGLLSVGYGQ